MPRYSGSILGTAACGVLLAFLLVFTGCRQQKADLPSPSPPVDPQLIAANTEFGFDLFAELRKETPTGNVFLSPLSVAMALHMTYNGSGTTTKEAMADVLAIQRMSFDELNQANAALRQGLESPGPGITLSIANSLWSRQGCPFAKDFLQTNRDYYGARIGELDFGDPAAVKVMNDWVREATEQRIDGIVEAPIGELVTLIILNAAYFKGEWQDPFLKEDTHPGEFTLLDGTRKPVPLMSRTGKVACYQGEGFRAAHLPYGRGRFGLDIFLPDPNSTLDQLCARAGQPGWDEPLRQAQKTEILLELPRFRVEWASSLLDALTALGMGIAFDEADFRPMQPDRPARWIGDVRHKAFLEVNEQGTEAAAATEVLMPEAGSPVGPTSFTVDRPFLCVIRDNETGALLFLGVVTDPDPL
jgi:serine protease inhibitor